MTTTSSLGWEMGLSTILDNCASNNSGASNRRAFYATNNLCRFIGCDGACINGFAFDNAAANTVCVACYGHDSVIGFRAASGVMFVFNNVFDTCSGSGVDVSNRSGCLLIGNTIYNCGTGITGTSHTWGLFLNNILDANTIGVEMTTPVDSNYFDYNCWNNTDDIQDSDINQGVHAVTGDPGMNNPTDGDFGVTEADANVHDKAIDAGDKTGAIV